MPKNLSVEEIQAINTVIRLLAEEEEIHERALADGRDGSADEIQAIRMARIRVQDCKLGLPPWLERYLPPEPAPAVEAGR